MSQTVAILTEDPVVRPLRPAFAAAFRLLAEEFRRLGVALTRCSVWEFVAARGEFSSSLTFVDGAWREGGPVRPYAVWYRESRFSAAASVVARAYGARFVNDPELVDVARDKYAIARRFPAFCARTELLARVLEEPVLLAAFPGDAVVLKNRYGHAGRGVELARKDGVARRCAEARLDARDWVVQEFIDCSGGVPGVARGRHDLRAFIVGDTLSHWSVRTAKADGFKVENVALPADSSGSVPVAAEGSTIDFLAGERKLPSILSALVDSVVADMGCPSGVWSVDCMLAAGGRAILGEISCSPDYSLDHPCPEEKARLASAVYGRIARLFRSLR